MTVVPANGTANTNHAGTRLGGGDPIKFRRHLTGGDHAGSTRKPLSRVNDSDGNGGGAPSVQNETPKVAALMAAVQSKEPQPPTIEPPAPAPQPKAMSAVHGPESALSGTDAYAQFNVQTLPARYDSPVKSPTWYGFLQSRTPTQLRELALSMKTNGERLAVQQPDGKIIARGEVIEQSRDGIGWQIVPTSGAPPHRVYVDKDSRMKIFVNNSAGRWDYAGDYTKYLPDMTMSNRDIYDQGPGSAHMHFYKTNSTRVVQNGLFQAGYGSWRDFPRDYNYHESDFRKEAESDANNGIRIEVRDNLDTSVKENKFNPFFSKKEQNTDAVRVKLNGISSKFDFNGKILAEGIPIKHDTFGSGWEFHPVDDINSSQNPQDAAPHRVFINGYNDMSVYARNTKGGWDYVGRSVPKFFGPNESLSSHSLEDLSKPDIDLLMSGTRAVHGSEGGFKNWRDFLTSDAFGSSIGEGADRTRQLEIRSGGEQGAGNLLAIAVPIHEKKLGNGLEIYPKYEDGSPQSKLDTIPVRVFRNNKGESSIFERAKDGAWKHISALSKDIVKIDDVVKIEISDFPRKDVALKISMSHYRNNNAMKTSNALADSVINDGVSGKLKINIVDFSKLPNLENYKISTSVYDSGNRRLYINHKAFSDVDDLNDTVGGRSRAGWNEAIIVEAFNDMNARSTSLRPSSDGLYASSSDIYDILVGWADQSSAEVTLAPDYTGVDVAPIKTDLSIESWADFFSPKAGSVPDLDGVKGKPFQIVEAERGTVVAQAVPIEHRVWGGGWEIKPTGYVDAPARSGMPPRDDLALYRLYPGNWQQPPAVFKEGASGWTHIGNHMPTFNPQVGIAGKQPSAQVDEVWTDQRDAALSLTPDYSGIEQAPRKTDWDFGSWRDFFYPNSETGYVPDLSGVKGKPFQIVEPGKEELLGQAVPIRHKVDGNGWEIRPSTQFGFSDPRDRHVYRVYDGNYSTMPSVFRQNAQGGWDYVGAQVPRTFEDELRLPKSDDQRDSALAVSPNYSEIDQATKLPGRDFMSWRHFFLPDPKAGHRRQISGPPRPFRIIEPSSGALQAEVVPIRHKVDGDGWEIRPALRHGEQFRQGDTAQHRIYFGNAHTPPSVFRRDGPERWDYVGTSLPRTFAQETEMIVAHKVNNADVAASEVG